MKVCSYAGDMNLNRKDKKYYVKIQKKMILRKQKGENFFSSENALYSYELFS